MADLKNNINCSYEDENSSSGLFTSNNPYKRLDEKNERASISQSKAKVFKVRYLMLFLYSLCTLANGFQWIQYPIIASIVTCYYNVSVTTTNWTAVLFMVMFMPFIFPVAWVMENKGLKLTLIIAAAGNSIGSCLQCVSLSPNRFDIVIITQTVASIAQVFSVSAPAYVAAVWFPANFVSTACAIGVLSNQMGIALGFIVPPLLVPNDCKDVKDVEMGLQNLALGQAVLNFLIFILIVIFFRDKPPIPPSIAEASKPSDHEATLKSIGVLFKNWNYDLLLISSGLLGSVYFAILTMLNQMVVRAFPGKEVDAGWMGFTNIVAGVVGSIVTGYIMDKTRVYRATSIVFFTLSLLCMIVHTAVFQLKILWLYYLMIGAIGFTMAGYMPIAYQLAAEITYPESEGTSTTLLVGSVSLFGILVTMFPSWLQQTYGDLYSNIFFCVCTTVGFILSLFIKCDNKRSSQEFTDLKQLQEPA